MDRITTEILERLCNGDSRERIAREMSIPVSWVQEAVDEYNRDARAPAIDMMGNIVDDFSHSGCMYKKQSSFVASACSSAPADGPHAGRARGYGRGHGHGVHDHDRDDGDGRPRHDGGGAQGRRRHSQHPPFVHQGSGMV